VKSKKEYIIQFIGLKLGFHEYQFDINDAFFADREYAIIHNGNVSVSLILEKKETMMIGEFTIDGSVYTDCDRCNDPIEVPVKGSYRLVYKFGTEISDDEALIVLHPDSYELDIRDNLYELITVSMPIRLVHAEGECNNEMLELLAKHTVQREESDDEDWDDEDWDDDDDWDDEEDDDDGEDDFDPKDPRWSALKNLN
jgi:uncharacterized metal-binding protein YceD (DUF177 family)